MTRTTLDLDPVVLRQLRSRQRREGKTLGQLTSELLARALHDTDVASAPRLQWTTADLRPLVDLDDKDAVASVLGDDEPQ